MTKYDCNKHQLLNILLIEHECFYILNIYYVFKLILTMYVCMHVYNNNNNNNNNSITKLVLCMNHNQELLCLVILLKVFIQKKREICIKECIINYAIKFAYRIMCFSKHGRRFSTYKYV